jgi:hypothetical protein
MPASAIGESPAASSGGFGDGVPGVDLRARAIASASRVAASLSIPTFVEDVPPFVGRDGVHPIERAAAI